MMHSSRKVKTLGSNVDALTLSEASEIVVQYLDSQSNLAGVDGAPACAYIVTPNLDHAVLLTENARLRAAYEEAALVLADGMPLLWAARLQGKRLPERVTGSDLTPYLLEHLSPGTRVFLLGASPKASKAASQEIARRFPQVSVVGRVSPPMGFEGSTIWSESITSQIRRSRAQLILVGLGAPKQEIWVHQHMHQMPGTVALCVGATIDFLAGQQKRAPQWVQRSGLEWVHRLSTNPGRLAGRYARDAVYFPALLLKDVLSSRNEEKVA